MQICYTKFEWKNVLVNLSSITSLLILKYKEVKRGTTKTRNSWFNKDEPFTFLVSVSTISSTMSSLVHRWLLLCGLTLFMFKDCQSFFLRHTQSRKCIAAGEEISDNDKATKYWVEMVDNCLNDRAEFCYRDSELLENIATEGTLVSNLKNATFRDRLFIQQSKDEQGEMFENSDKHRLKQTADGSLFLYDDEVNSCAQPNGSYVDLKKDGCQNQKFTFGSVTKYDTQMKDVGCSPKQYMMIKRADYGNFNNNGVFEDDQNVDSTCSNLTNCQIKSRCDGKKSCELTMDSNLLPSLYCSDTSKQIYTEYTCADSNRSTIITAAPNIRLWSSSYSGFIQIKDGSKWRYVNEEHWDKNRQKMLCRHLGFKETDANANKYWMTGIKRSIASGDLICYTTKSGGTSCCTHLAPSESSSYHRSYATCKICNKPLLNNAKFSVGHDWYDSHNSIIANDGWCPSMSDAYLLIDLQNEYHITQVVVMGNRDQTKWSESYSMHYSHDTTYTNTKKIKGNQNGYQASTTKKVNIYNVRHIKIRSTGNTAFCLRIELCGKLQTPAPVGNISITSYQYAARVTWRIRAPQYSSYITKIIIYIGGLTEYQIISRTQTTQSVIIKRFKPNTEYNVQIQTEDGYSQSKKVSKTFTTKMPAREICDKPLLQNTHTFHSGRGGGNYPNARLTSSGWCPTGSTRYLLIDLKREYHLTHVVVITDTTQQRSTYTLTYSRTHFGSWINGNNPIEITENLNNFQPTTKRLKGVYNAKYIKIQSTATEEIKFCLRIELCGEAQTPAPVDNLRITSYQYAARVQWNIRTEPRESSYITKMIIYIDGSEYRTLSRGQRDQSIVIKKFKPYTRYKVEIQTEDAYSSESKNVSQSFSTKTAGKICNKPLLQDTRAFPNRVSYSGHGSGNYQNARLTKTGWCPSGSTPYLSIDLQKEYHLTHAVVITDKTQQSSSTYSLIYGRVGRRWINWNNPIQITDDQEYRPSIKNLDGVYNARFIRIQSTATGHVHFCLRIELCGEVQKPAAVYQVAVTPFSKSARVSWEIRTPPAQSSYITGYRIYLNRQLHSTLNYRSTNQITIQGLKPYTKYTVGIVALDDNSERSSNTSENFTTTTAAPSEAPTSVKFTKRSRNKLTISWSAPSKSSLNGVLTGYQVCYADQARSRNLNCFEINATDSDTAQSQISNLRPSTKYFVTVQAGTSAGFGRKSWPEISKITNGERVNPVATSYSSLSLNITKQASYIKSVMIIVKDTGKDKGVEQIERSDLKPYDANTRDLYVTAYLNAEVLPLTFVIGDGKEYYYEYERQKYFNQPLKQDTNYVVFLRFFEYWNSYYSTQWSEVVKTFAKPPAPVNLNCFSTAPKKYTISWTQPLLPDQTSVLKYHGNYSSSNGTGVTLSITTEMRSVTVDVEFERQYTFKIQVETRAGRSNITSKSWTSHSAPLKLLNATDGYIVMLRKPKKEKIKTVALVILQLRSETNKPPAPENLDVKNSPPSDTKADNVGFIAKEYNVAEFQNDTIEIALRKSSGKRRRKREAAGVYTLAPGATYRIAQMNTDDLENPYWSYWSDSFTFAEAINDERDGADGGGSVGVAIGASFAVIVIIVTVVILVFFFLKKRRAREEHEEEDKEMEEVKKDKDDQEGIYLNKNDEVEEDVRPPVPVAEFAHYVSEMKENDNYEFQKEYGDLPSNTNTSWEVSKKPFNKEKNRYGNIVTYDHCRVVLSGDEKNDYINASYIDGIKENSYIATQGPTLLTLNDMWRMVWEQRSYSIVMVTSLVELFKTKCEKYWPDSGTEKYGDIEVTLLSVEEFAYYVVHTLQLKKDEEEREVRHYYFQSWPDHGVPKYPTQILAFRRHFRTHHMEQSGPIIVHCSAGVGRTGVFLAIDTILDKLEKGFINSIDVFGQVCAMRERRMYMVQTLAQYIFVHEAILESIICGTNEVDTSKVEKEIKTLAEVKESGMTGFQEKFETLCGITPKLSPEECSAGLLKANYNKNRDKEIYPAESSRVPLQSIDEVEDSDYINAVFVQGYLGRNYFIATQSPLPDTVIDFWRLVHSQKSSTIVLLNNVKDGTAFPKFWPTNKGEPTQYGSLTVQLDSEKHSDGIWTRKFTLSPDSDLSDGQAVNIFHYTKWPDHHVPTNADAVVKLTSLVENSIKNYGLGPVIVACSDGAGRTGTYIAISNLLERTKIEQAIDVFQAIKIIRGTRPQFVENAEQYEFCYTAVKAYLDGFSDYANFE